MQRVYRQRKLLTHFNGEIILPYESLITLRKIIKNTEKSLPQNVQ